MRVPTATWCAALAIMARCGSVAWCGVPLGIPIATLEEQQWAVGLEYGYEETDLEAFGHRVRTLTEGGSSYAAESIRIETLQTRMIFGSLAYGVCDNWDLFLRLGVSDAQDGIRIDTLPTSGGPERFSYDGNYGLAWGLGTRATFCHWGPWRFGGSIQVTWFDPGDSDFSSPDPSAADTVFAGSADIDLWQTQVALAAAYQIDTLTFWAGPFLQFTEGDLCRHGRVLVDGVDSGSFSGSADIEETSQIGVHLGVNWEVSPELDCRMEGQFTGDSWLLGISGVIQPAQLLLRL